MKYNDDLLNDLNELKKYILFETSRYTYKIFEDGDEIKIPNEIKELDIKNTVKAKRMIKNIQNLNWQE